jgi:iron complex outermembrane recepter protein
VFDQPFVPGEFMFKMTQVSVGLAAAFGSSLLLVLGPAVAQQQPQRVEITGSAIKRIAAEAPVPVQVITRAEIERTGATSINELLKSISVIDINDQGELASNSPGGSGTARVRLRGLGDTQTLVLINGRRVPKNPLADATGAGSAFNVNSIPISAIERIDILKDGGSAIYGADAVAGVVNFILRKDYEGGNLRAGYGQSSRRDGAERTYNGVFGFGDLANDRYNVMVAVDFLKREPIFRKDREISRSVDFRRFGAVPGYNLDGRSVFAPEGNYLTAAGTLAGQTVTPCPAANLSGPLCVYDFNASLLTIYNGADRSSALVSGGVRVTNDLTVSARWIGSESKDNFEAHPVPDFFTSPVGAPFPSYAGRFMQGGPRITDRKGTLNHFDVTAEGMFAGVEYSVGLTDSKSKSKNSDRNYYNRTLWNAATRSGAIDATALDNDEALVESLKVSPVRTGDEKLRQFDIKLSGEAFALPAGPIRYAVGLVSLKEKIKDTPDPLTQQGLVVGSIQQSAVQAERDSKSLFAELQLPITKSIEGQLAVRRDDYDTAASTSPKIAVKWQAVSALAFRASVSEAFKMPTLKQQFASAGQGAITLTQGQCVQVGGGDAAACANGLPAFRVTGSNPNLGPETGKTYNVGVIAEQGPLQVVVDFFQIDKEDNISTPTIQTAIDQGFFGRDSQNRVIVLQNLQNFAQSKNSGVDVEGRIRVPGTPIGDLRLQGSVTYYRHQATRTTATSPWAEFNGTYNTPRWRSAFSATVTNGPWTLTGLVRGTGGFWDTDVSYNGWTATTPGRNRKVGAHDEVDFTVSWEGVKNLKLSGSMKNVFDNMPPFSARNATSNNYTQAGFAELYTPRGRFWQVGLEYNF